MICLHCFHIGEISWRQLRSLVFRTPLHWSWRERLGRNQLLLDQYCAILSFFILNFSFGKFLLKWLLYLKLTLHVFVSLFQWFRWYTVKKVICCHFPWFFVQWVEATSDSEIRDLVGVTEVREVVSHIGNTQCMGIFTYIYHVTLSPNAVQYAIHWVSGMLERPVY